MIKIGSVRFVSHEDSICQNAFHHNKKRLAIKLITNLLAVHYTNSITVFITL